MIGTIISHYRIIGPVGRGGMGVVYKAEDTRLKRTVALKFLPAAASLDPDAKERFKREAETASALDHPNICTIYDVDESADGQLFISMAYYQGETLKEKIEREPLPIDDAVDIGLQIARGLQAAHDAGVTHRDIKAANVILPTKGEAKILDFGLARVNDRTMLTKGSATLGTISYMSPEQAKGETVDHRTDIWSLGVLLYEMITGRLPFRGDYDQAIIYQTLNAEPDPLEGSARALSADENTLCRPTVAEKRIPGWRPTLVPDRSKSKEVVTVDTDRRSRRGDNHPCRYRNLPLDPSFRRDRFGSPLAVRQRHQ
jgi:serine/threonine protein kinase